MSRNRIIYQSEALYVSDRVDSVCELNHKQVHRIQSANYGFNIPRTDINQYGQLARIDALVIQSPVVSFDFSYYVTDGNNESNLGFYVQNEFPIYTGQDGTETTKELGTLSGYITGSEVNFLSGHLNDYSGKNYFIVTTKEGYDLNTENTLSGKSVIGIGNAVLTNYTFNAKVGDIPTVNVSAEGLNINSALYKNYLINTNLTGLGFPTPEVDPVEGSPLSYDGNGNYKLIKLPQSSNNTGQDIINALRPGDITLDFGDYGSSPDGARPINNVFGNSLNMSEDALHLQSASLQIDLKRTPLQKLGNKFAFTRSIDFPITAKLNISAIVNETQSRNLAEMLNDQEQREITITVKNPKDLTKNALKYTLKGTFLSNESLVSSIGANKNADLVFELQIGGINDIDHGIFVKGLTSSITQVSVDSLSFSASATDWFDINSWTPKSLPTSSQTVVMHGTNAITVDIDNVLWVQPAVIDTTSVVEYYGIILTSTTHKQFSGTVIGNITLNGVDLI